MLDDLRFAWRRLVHAPLFTAAAILTLALAVGANTAIFSIADAVLFKPLPYADADRIHLLLVEDTKTGRRFTSIPSEFVRTIDEQHRRVSAAGLLEDVDLRDAFMPTASGPEWVPVIGVSANYFDLLGASAARGRLFTSSDAPYAGRIALLTYASWKQRFAGDDTIVGRSVTLGSSAFEVIGVLPEGFVFPSPFGPGRSAGIAGRTAELVTVLEPRRPGATGGTFYPIVRREPGVTIEEAQHELDALSRAYASRDPRWATSRAVLEDVRTLLYPTGRPVMKYLLGAALLVLLLGCANLANIFLARGRRLDREMGVRTALGASRLRLIRPLVCEALLIGLAASGVAMIMTLWTFDALIGEVPRQAYRNAPVGLDVRVAVFTVILGLAGALVFSVAPAWRSARVDVRPLLQRQTTATRRHYYGGPMVAAQVTVAIVLLFGAVTATRALLGVLAIPLGFSTDNVITVRGAPRGLRGRDRQAFYVRALERLSARADVISSGAAGSVPFDNALPDEGVQHPGTSQLAAGIVHVLPGFFETAGIRLLRGRLLTADDERTRADVGVASESAARVLFGGRDPIGGTFTSEAGRTFTVVGVVSDVVKTLERPMAPQVYVIPGESVGNMTLFIRTRARDESVLAAVKRDVSALAPNTQVTAAWWSDSLANVMAYRAPRFQTLVLGSFAVLALALTAVGIFGSVAFLTTGRTHEMGVRLAIGATPASLIALVVQQAVVPVAAGLAAGLIATWWARRLAESQLYNVNARDPSTIGIALVTVAVTALVAAYLPARRAGRVNPVEVLRAE